MSNTIDSQSYPQFITGNPALARNAGVSCAGFEDFRIYPAVQNRPRAIESWERTPLGILLTLLPALLFKKRLAALTMLHVMAQVGKKLHENDHK